jgi:hypothetical protein
MERPHIGLIKMMLVLEKKIIFIYKTKKRAIKTAHTTLVIEILQAARKKLKN